MKDKNTTTTTIKQTFSYGKSKTVTVEVVQKKKRNKEKNILSNEVKNKSKISDLFSTFLFKTFFSLLLFLFSTTSTVTVLDLPYEKVCLIVDVFLFLLFIKLFF